VHQEFWDGVNFKRGANPPRGQWKAPPQRPAAETEGAFERFGQYVDHIRAIPGVHFITARDLPTRYPDKVRSVGATREDLDEIARRLTADRSEGVNFVVVGGKAFSPADQFALLVEAVGNPKVTFPLPVKGLLGPDAAPPTAGDERVVDRDALAMALADVQSFVKSEGRVPARVFIGADPVAPADFMVGLARAWRGKDLRLGKNVEVLTGRRVAKDTPGLFGGWVIHKEGFRAPKVLEVARLQAWTLKPAVVEGGDE
jgi:hypothetical protein